MGALAIIFLSLIFLAGFVLLAVFYLLTLQNTMKEVSPHNQQVPPSNVWLMFIPFFNIIYPFILYPKICDSIRDEYEERGLEPQGDFSRSLGITMPILGLCSIIPFLGIIALLGHLVIWIIFWAKVSEYKNELALSQGQLNKRRVNNNTDLLD